MTLPPPPASPTEGRPPPPSPSSTPSSTTSEPTAPPSPSPSPSGDPSMPAAPVAPAPSSDVGREVGEAARTAHAILDEVERAVVGKRDRLSLVLAGLLADGHILLDDLPGVAKTLTARSLATAVGFDFARVQFTADLLPADITGSLVLDLASHQPEFRPGPVFTNLLLADEINRAPAKTQSALLEAMQERQVSVDGSAHPLTPPFLVIATQNPIESEGTYPLPEAQLDRFILRTSMGYPNATDEAGLLAARVERRTDEVELQPVCDRERFLQLQQAVELVHVDPRLLEYAVAVVGATRDDANLSVGASPRGSLALLKLSRAWALLNGRDYVGPDDLRAVAVPALAHRVMVTDEVWARGTPVSALLQRVLDRVPAPSPR